MSLSGIVWLGEVDGGRENEGGRGISRCLCQEIHWILGQVGMQFQIGSRRHRVVLRVKLAGAVGWNSVERRSEDSEGERGQDGVGFGTCLPC